MPTLRSPKKGRRCLSRWMKNWQVPLFRPTLMTSRCSWQSHSLRPKDTIKYLGSYCSTPEIARQSGRPTQCWNKKLRSQLRCCELVAMQYPGVARTVGLVAGVAPMDERKAQLAMSVSFQPTARRDSLVSLSQDRAASITVRTALRMQRECFQRHFREHTRVIDAPDTAAGWMRENKINVIDWGWDETTQKVKGKHLNLLAGERQPEGKTSAQIIVQRGRMSRYEYDGHNNSHRTVSEPLLARAMVLPSTAADFLLEAVLKAYPFDVKDRDEVAKVAAGPDLVVLTFCTDRASGNLLALKYIWQQLRSENIPRNIVPHAEPCSAHGVALVKAKSTGVKEVIGGCSSLSGLMRQWKFTGALRDELIQLVRTRLRVVTNARPAEQMASSRRLVEQVFGSLKACEFLLFREQTWR